MADIAELVAALGGMAQKQQLVKLGARDIDLTLAVRRGEVLRARNGWYSTFEAADPRFRAVRVGGRLTGLSAIVAMGGWVLATPPLHVAVPENASRLRTQWNRKRQLVPGSGAVVVHWSAPDVAARGSATIVGLSDALEQVALTESIEDTIAAFDWALHTAQIDRIDFERILLRLPESLRFIAEWVDIDCESLPESLSRTRLRLSGHTVVSQVPVAVVKAIDLVVDEAVGLEVDGEKYHLTRFVEDRDKDLDITLDGLHAIRPAATFVFYEWARVERSIEVALEQRGLPAHGNSGLTAASARRIRSITGGRRGRRRPTPEFPIVTSFAAPGQLGNSPASRRS